MVKSSFCVANDIKLTPIITELLPSHDQLYYQGWQRDCRLRLR